MIPFYTRLKTDDGRSFGPELELELEVAIEEGEVVVTHVWADTDLASKLPIGWEPAGQSNLLDPLSGDTAHRIGLQAKEEAERDIDWCSDVVRNSVEEAA